MADPKPKNAPALSVVSPGGAFRRAGRQFGPVPTLIPLSELSKDQIAALRAEPLLVVKDAEIPL
jgi:hypothetical protein